MPSGSCCGADTMLTLFHLLDILQNLKRAYFLVLLEIQLPDGLFLILSTCPSLSCPFLEPKQGLNCRSSDDPVTHTNTGPTDELT